MVAWLWFASTRLHRRGCWRAARLLKALNFLLVGAILPPEVRLDEPPELGHLGLGIVSHPNVIVHRGVRIYHRVTLATDVALVDRRRLVIESNVIIGVGAVLVGPIRVGTGSIIGANAVVVADVPPWSVVAGNPAKVVGDAAKSRQRRAAEAASLAADASGVDPGGRP
jgi:serine O-acetyltransferase